MPQDAPLNNGAPHSTVPLGAAGGLTRYHAQTTALQLANL